MSLSKLYKKDWSYVALSANNNTLTFHSNVGWMQKHFMKSANFDNYKWIVGDLNAQQDNVRSDP